MTETTETPVPVTKPRKAKSPSKADLLNRLAVLEAAFAAQATAPKPVAPSALEAAQAELAAMHPRAALAFEAPKGPRPVPVPYKGLVRAKEKCAIGCWHDKDEVFEVDLPALWTDDPFEPVREVSRSMPTEQFPAGKPIYETRTDVAIIDWRFRPTREPEIIARAM